MNYSNLYGTKIEPNCAYCSNNTTPDAAPTCTEKTTINEKGMCKKFKYDPLMRKPAPPTK